jgi:GT2 family glycosyltransferase
MSGEARCAVIIPTYNGAHLLSSCLEALFAHPPERCEWEVIVVDDASDDGTAERFAAYDERLSLIAREANGGFATACNEGAAAAGEADFLVFLNNDTVPVPGWLDALADAAAAHPEAAAFGSRLLYPDGTIQHAGVMIGQDRWPRHLYAGLPGEHSAVTRPKRVAAVTAACVLVRHEIFDRLGGFDTAFLNGYEDIDLCLRMGAEGHEIRYCPDSVLYHLESITRGSNDENGHGERNSRLYLERWHDRTQPDDFEHYLADGLIEVEYADFFPIELTISPLLGAVSRGTEEDERLERLVTVRSRQVLELQSERTRAALAQRREEVKLPAPVPRRRRSGGSPQVLNTGGFHRLGGGRGRHRVSLLMPLMDAAQALRRTLPLVLGQDAAAELEIIAVDSASRDDTISALQEFDATVIAIDPAEFDHGLTRNLLAEHARGDVLVFLNQRSRPCDDRWLSALLEALDSDPSVAGASSRVLPYPDADPLTKRDGSLDPSGSPDRWVKRIEDWSEYAAMPVEQRRLLLNFHTVSAAIRADVFGQFPFQSVTTMGEDLLWAREVLEAGMALVHEPGSRVYHSHEYSLREWFMRNVDDGIANNEINGRELSDAAADALVRGMIASDWKFLREELGLEGQELEDWQVQAALRRAAQAAGQWLGVNGTTMPPAVLEAFSRVANSRREGP